MLYAFALVCLVYGLLCALRLRKLETRLQGTEDELAFWRDRVLQRIEANAGKGDGFLPGGRLVLDDNTLNVLPRVIGDHASGYDRVDDPLLAVGDVATFAEPFTTVDRDGDADGELRHRC